MSRVNPVGGTSVSLGAIGTGSLVAQSTSTSAAGATSTTAVASSTAGAASAYFAGFGAGPATPSHSYLLSTVNWPLIDTLLGGTVAMVNAGRAYLPQAPAETDTSYTAKLGRNYLWPVLDTAMSSLANAPFQKAPVIPTMPGNLQALEQSVDLRRTTLGAMAQRLFEDGIGYGRSFLFVDNPDTARAVRSRGGDVDPASGSARSADIDAINPRLRAPVWRHYKHGDVIDIERDEFDDSIVSCRLLESFEGQDPTGVDQWAKKIVYQVRYVTKREIVVYRWNDGKPTGEQAATAGQGEGNASRQWELLSREPNPWGVVPLVEFYPEDPEGGVTLSPMSKLAELNLRHWQSMGDMRNVLWYAGIPFLQAIGTLMTQKEGDPPPVVAPDALFHFNNGSQGMNYVEVGGSSISAMRTHIQDLEEHGRQLGAQPLNNEATDRTATEVEVDESRTRTVLEAWTDRCQAAVNEAVRLSFIVGGLGEQYDHGEHRVKFQRNLPVASAVQAELQELRSAVGEGLLPGRVLLDRYQQVGMVDPQEDVNSLLEEARSEFEEAMDRAIDRNRLNSGNGSDPNDVPTDDPPGSGSGEEPVVDAGDAAA